MGNTVKQTRLALALFQKLLIIVFFWCNLFFFVQIQRINTTNIVDISTEFVNSYDRFKNKDVLLEMMNDLFSSVRRVISPITRRNADKVVQLGVVRSKRKL